MQQQYNAGQVYKKIMDAMFDVDDVDGRKAMQSKSGIGGVIKNNSKL